MCGVAVWAVTYWPVPGLVVGLGCVGGGGLVVPGVSVPGPPALDPEVEAPPDVPEGASEGMPDEVLPVLLPEGVVDEAPPLDVSLDPPPELMPELLMAPLSELPAGIPVHAPNRITHAIGNIHFVIDHSRSCQREARTRRAPKTALQMQRVEARSGGKFGARRRRLRSRKSHAATCVNRGSKSGGFFRYRFLCSDFFRGGLFCDGLACSLLCRHGFCRRL